MWYSAVEWFYWVIIHSSIYSFIHSSIFFFDRFFVNQFNYLFVISIHLFVDSLIHHFLSSIAFLFLSFLESINLVIYLSFYSTFFPSIFDMSVNRWLFNSEFIISSLCTIFLGTWYVMSPLMVIYGISRGIWVSTGLRTSIVAVHMCVWVAVRYCVYLLLRRLVCQSVSQSVSHVSHSVQRGSINRIYHVF